MIKCVWFLGNGMAKYIRLIGENIVRWNLKWRISAICGAEIVVKIWNGTWESFQKF